MFLQKNLSILSCESQLELHMHNQIFSTIDNWMEMNKKHRFHNRFQNIQTVIIEKFKNSYVRNGQNRSKWPKKEVNMAKIGQNGQKKGQNGQMLTVFSEIYNQLLDKFVIID